MGNDTSHAIQVHTGDGDPSPTAQAHQAVYECAQFIADQTKAESRLVGHKDWKNTGCPGPDLYAVTGALDELAAPLVAPAPPTLTDVVAMIPVEDNYAVVDSAGVVQVFGDAPHYGDMHGVNLEAPVVNAAATPQAHGYYLVAGDGGVFTFGDATFHGSMYGLTLDAPIVDIVPTYAGYWLVAGDGGVFAFGSATYEGRPAIAEAP